VIRVPAPCLFRRGTEVGIVVMVEKVP